VTVVRSEEKAPTTGNGRGNEAATEEGAALCVQGTHVCLNCGAAVSRRHRVRGEFTCANPADDLISACIALLGGEAR
jgi:hypothetical protein